MTPLHHIGETLRQALLQVPLSVVRLVFAAVFLALLVWVLALPKAHTTPARSDIKPGENLKLWAVLALGIQIVIYLCL